MGMGNFLDPGGMTGGLLAGGSLANMAVGRITIDTSSIASARQVVVREAKVMGDELQQVGNRTDRGVTQATGALKRLENGIESARSRASLLLAAFVTGGIAAAQSVKGLEMRMVALSGSQEKAAEQMDLLRKQADAAGQPFLSLVEGATGLLPAIRGTNADLGKTVMLAQRLAMMDPAQGVAGASFAIREFLNGEYISLTRRLELDRTRLREILAEADGDAAKAISGLSEYIDEIGISERQLTEMGKEGAYAFAVLRDEGKQTLAEVFTPFLNDVLIPITRELNRILRLAREMDPALMKVAGITAGFMGTAALAQRGLPLIGAIPGGGKLARAGVTAGALYAGSQIGVGAARLAGNLGVPGFGRFEGTSQSEANAMITDTMKQIGVILLSSFAGLAKQMVMAGLNLRNAFNWVVAAIRWGGSKLVEGLVAVLNMLGAIPALYGAELIDKGMVDLGAQIVEWSSGLFDASDALRTLIGDTGAYEDMLRRGIGLTVEQQKVYQTSAESLDLLVVEFGKWLGVVKEAPNKLADMAAQFFIKIRDAARDAEGARPLDRGIKVNEDVLEAWSDFQGKLGDIDRQEREDRLAAVREYRERTQREYEQYTERVADTEADFALDRQRALEERQRRESEIATDLAARTQEENAAHQERMAEFTAEYLDRREDVEAEHYERMAQIQRSARRDMLNAAARLDASGVLEARQRMEDQKSDEQRAYEKRLADLDEWLRESQEREQRAYEKRLESAQEAAGEQLAELRDRYAREERLATENKNKRLAELRTQYQREMSELHQQHNQRLQQIARNAANERQVAETGFIRTFNALQIAAGAHQNAMIGIQNQGAALMETALRAWWERQKAMIAGQGQAAAPWRAQLAMPQYHALTPRQTGGRAAATGAYRLEQGEYVLRPDVARTIDRMLGGNMTQAALLSAMAGRGARGDITINGMSVPVTLEAGMDARSAAGRVGAEVEQRIFAVLSELLS